jgi:ubiquinone/menaquinone biosynthesis C-methylase UbiE
MGETGSRMNAFSDGDAYERLMGRWSRSVGIQFLDWLNLPKGLQCVDVGCGNGAFTEVLAARVAPSELAGLDPSEEQIDFAKIREGTRLAQFRVGDAQALPYPDRSFDVAIMALVISFVPDPAKAVAEMARVVRPGGLVGTYMWSNMSPQRPIFATMSELGFPIVVRSNNASELGNMQSLWAQAGLASIQTCMIDISVTFSDFDDFWDSNYTPAGPVGKAIAKLSAADRDRVRSRLRECLPQDGSGHISYQARANAVKGIVPG